MPYLQFHPSLTTALQSDNEDLRHRHQRRYYEFSGYLYNADNKNPIETRAIVKRELPNLLFAVKGALVGATDYAVGFVVVSIEAKISCFFTFKFERRVEKDGIVDCSVSERVRVYRTVSELLIRAGARGFRAGHSDCGRDERGRDAAGD